MSTISESWANLKKKPMLLIFFCFFMLLFVLHTFSSHQLNVIGLILIIIAFLPWLAPYIKTIELPGGGKIELKDVDNATKQAKSAGLLSETYESEPALKPYFAKIVDEDPTLAVAGLRIKIEEKLADIAYSNGMELRNRSAGFLLNELMRREYISSQESGALREIIAIANKAIHGGKIDIETARYAIDTGLKIMDALDKYVKVKSQKIFDHMGKQYEIKVFESETGYLVKAFDGSMPINKLRYSVSKITDDQFRDINGESSINELIKIAELDIKSENL